MQHDLARALAGSSGPVSPAVQLRLLLRLGRERGWLFDVAWKWSFERVRMPHDTSARREWRDILGKTFDDERPVPLAQREMWRRAYDRSGVTRDEAAGGRLLLAA